MLRFFEYAMFTFYYVVLYITWHARKSSRSHKYDHMMLKYSRDNKISSRTYYYIWYNLTQIRPISIRTGKCFLNSAFECLETYLVWSSILFSTAKYQKRFESYHFLIWLHNFDRNNISNSRFKEPYFYWQLKFYIRTDQQSNVLRCLNKV